MQDKEKAEKSGTAALSVQTRPRENYLSQFSFDSGSFFERRLYRELRERVPVIDAAISKIRRLVGSFKVETGSERLDKKLETFLRSIKVGAMSVGIDEFLGTYLEELLTYGTAVGEMVVSGGKIAALYNTNLDIIGFKQISPIDVRVCTVSGGELVPCRYPQLIFSSALNPEPGRSTGVSLLRGLPFISEILMKIYSSIGTNWERLGNVRFAVSCSQDSGVYAPDRAKQIADEWQKAMSKDSLSDFISVGEVNIKAIGADIAFPDSEIPVRQLLEQIVAKLGIPPFLLGFSWSSTERMSSQQADILTSELESYRRMLNPIITRIVRLWLTLEGEQSKEICILWDDISMQDEVDHSQAELNMAKAEKIRRKFSEN